MLSDYSKNLLFYSMEINCRKCKHFYITWDINHPYGCKSFGMKTKQMPSLAVYTTSGSDCLKFQKKEDPPKK